VQAIFRHNRSIKALISRPINIEQAQAHCLIHAVTLLSQLVCEEYNTRNQMIELSVFTQ
jgi:hypothetical protein